MFRKFSILGLALVWSVSLMLGCSSPKDSCGTGTSWDEAKQKCVWTNETKLRCSENTLSQGGKCVPKVEKCSGEQILDEKTGKCIDRATQCGDKAVLDKATGKCVPQKLLACGQDSIEKDGKCVPKSTLSCGPNTTELNGKCVPDKASICASDAQFDAASGKCVPKKVVKCGGNTQTKDDKCVPDAVNCQAGTQLDEKLGKCVVAATACEQGTQLDAQTGKCVVSNKVCAAGTAFTGGQCVPVKDACQAGTKFDDTTKTCLPDASCKPGDTLINGLCYSPATKIATEKDTDETENNDPSKGGTATPITLKEAGKKTVFVGTIGEPQDLNGDKVPDQDVDVFTFQAKAGKWYKVYVQSMGLPAPAFVVRGMYDATSKSYRYIRVSSLAEGSGPGRLLFIPEDGAYTISVLPSVVLVSSTGFNPDGPFGYGPVGAKDWEYVGVIEELTAPTAGTLDVASQTPTIKGDLSIITGNNVYTVSNGQPSERLEIELKVRPAGVNPLVIIWDGKTLVSSGSFNKENKAYVSLPETGPVTLIVDWDVAWGKDQKYEGTVATNGIGAIFDMASGITKTFKIKVKPLTVVVMVYSLISGVDEEIEVNVVDAQSQTVYDNTYMYYGDIGAFFSEKGGDYTVTVTRYWSDVMRINFQIQYRPAKPLGLDKKPGDTITHSETTALKKNDLRYFYFSLKEDADFSGLIEGGNGPAEDVDANLYDTTLKTVLSGLTAGNVTWTKKFLKTGGYVVEFQAGVDLPKGYKMEFSLTDPPPAEKEPNGTIQTANVYKIGTKLLGEFTGGDKDVYKFTLAQNMAADDVLVIKLDSSLSYSTYACKLLNSTNVVLWSNDDFSKYGCYFHVSGLTAGDYYLDFEYKSTTTSKYAYELTSSIVKGIPEVEPNNDDGTAQVIQSLTAPIYGRLFCDALTTSLPTSTSCTQNEVSRDTYDIAIPTVSSGEKIILESKFEGTYTTTSYGVKMELIDVGANKVLVTGSIGKRLIFDNTTVPQGRYVLRLSYDSTTMYKYYDFWYQISLTKATLTLVNDADATTAGSNDSFAKAQVVTGLLPIILRGDVPAAPKDYDYYKITLAADVPTGKVLSLVLNEAPTSAAFGNTSSIQIHVYDSTQKLISEQTGYTGYPKTVTIPAAKKGDYYIMIDRDSTTTDYGGSHEVFISIQ